MITYIFVWRQNIQLLLKRSRRNIFFFLYKFFKKSRDYGNGLELIQPVDISHERTV